MRLPNPIQGVFTKTAAIDTPAVYTPYANNVRAIDVQAGQMRIGQRPGLVKLNANQLGSSGQPIVAMVMVNVLENTED